MKVRASTLMRVTYVTFFLLLSSCQQEEVAPDPQEVAILKCFTDSSEGCMDLVDLCFGGTHTACKRLQPAIEILEEQCADAVLGSCDRLVELCHTNIVQPACRSRDSAVKVLEAACRNKGDYCLEAHDVLARSGEIYERRAILALSYGCWQQQESACKLKADWCAIRRDFIDCNKDMTYIPAGNFWMGCSAKPGEKCQKDEKPGREVYLDAFAIDTTRVTLRDYWECVFDGPCVMHPKGSIAYISRFSIKEKLVQYKNAAMPVLGLSWQAANTYCQWRGKRLPTEAEWEKAARGISREHYVEIEERAKSYIGDRWGISWVKKERTGCDYELTTPYGLCDMVNPYYEWTHDWYSETYYQDAPLKNPTGPSVGKTRVSRSVLSYSGFDGRIDFPMDKWTRHLYSAIGKRTHGSPLKWNTASTSDGYLWSKTAFRCAR
jgi:formylglycine-generating enzyme